jgi:hypothetical protein
MIAATIGPMTILIEKMQMWNMFPPDYATDNEVAEFCD